MALQNVHRIEADIKQKRYAEEPRVTSNDDIAFAVTVTDNGQPVDMAAVTMVVLASTRGDRQTVITPGTKQADGSLLFELGSSETAIVGQVKGVAQLFDAQGDRISSVVFTYQVDRDPTGNGYIPTEKDKTFIEIVLVEGPAVIQEAKDVTVTANQSVANADGATGRANTAAGNAEAVVADFATVKQSAAKNKEFSTVDDRFEELEGDSYLPMKNEIINGNFSNGVVNWNPQFSTLSANANVLTVTGDNINSAMFASNTWGKSLRNHQYYTKAEVRTKDINCDQIAIEFRNNNGVNSRSIVYPVLDKWYSLTNIFLDQTGDYAFSYLRISQRYPATKVASGSMEVKNVILIDLTDTFGAGNEPTIEEIDQLLGHHSNNWFDGTVNLAGNKKILPFLLNQIRKKANKQQEDWFTPTLVNGWAPHGTSKVGYYKDSSGRVHLRGRVSGATVASIIFTLPAGYRPPQEVNLPVFHRINKVEQIEITPGGAVYAFGVPTTQYISLDGISFRT